MKHKSLIKGLFLLIILFSCKNEETKEAQSETIKPLLFDVSVELKIKKDDDLILYYKDGSNEWIVEDKAVWYSVKGNENFQNIVFHLPEGVIPNDFRFDIGRNEFKNQEPIEIRSFTMKYLDKSFTINQDQFDLFFKPNQFIKYDAKIRHYSFTKDEKGNYDPFFDTRPVFYQQLTNLISKQ